MRLLTKTANIIAATVMRNVLQVTVTEVEGKPLGHSDNRKNNGQVEKQREQKASLVCAILSRRQENRRRMR